MPDDRESQIIQYFLGQLPAGDCAAIEHRQSTDPAFQEWCEAIEAEFIDEYVQGRLSLQEAKQFECNYLTTRERADKVEFAKAMLRSFSDVQPRRLRLSVVATLAVAVLCVLGLWAVLARRRVPVPIVEYTLRAGSTRDLAAPQVLPLPGGAVLLKLSMQVDSGSRVDHASLRNLLTDDEVWSQRVFPRSDGGIEAWAPISMLTGGDYLLTLRAGSDSIQTFLFRIE